MMKAVIFDMDGVIFDSERAIYKLWLELGDRYGIKDIEIPYRRSIGTNRETAKRIYLDYYGEDAEYDSYKAEISAEYHRRYDNGRLPLMKGVRELLCCLKSAGFRTAIGSSTRTELVQRQIEDAGLTEYFDALAGGDLVQRSKPEPDIFFKAAELLGCRAEECFVIEDSYNGIRAAKAAGMTPIMVPDMMEPDDEMREKAALILPDLLAVRDYLKENSI